MIEYGAGAVWWGQIDFQDGEHKKYLVLLSDCSEDGAQGLAAMTTSRGEQRYANASTGSPCLATGRAYRIERAQENCFPVTTWVQFDNAYPISRASLEQLKTAKRAGFIQVLAEERLRSLLSCAKKSDDVSKRDLARIDLALKARTPLKKAAPARQAASTTPPAFVSTELLAIRVRVGRFCVGCRDALVELIEITDADLTAVLQGVRPAATNFAENVTAALDLLGDQHAKCTSCRKSS